MRRLIRLLLVLSIISTSGSPASGGARLLPHAAAAPDVDVNVSPTVRVVPSTVKVKLDERRPSAVAADQIDVAAQRGECESVQLWMRHSSDTTALHNISVHFAPLLGSGGASPDDVASPMFAAAHWSARQQGYVYCQKNKDFIPSVDQSPSWQPDPLLRLDLPDGGSAPPSHALYPAWERGPTGVIPYVPPNHTQSVWATVCVPRTATPGNYSGEFSIRGLVGTAHAAWQHSVKVKLEVWTLTLAELGAEGTLDTAFIWLEPTSNDNNWTQDCMPQGNDTLYRECPQRDEWFRFLRRNRVPPDFGGNALGGSYHSLAETRARRDQAGARWQNLLDVSVLGGNCTCKSGHACNYTDEYVDELLMPLLRRIVPPIEKAGLLDSVYAYGFDEAPEGCIPSMYKLFGALKKEFPKLRTVATFSGFSHVPTDLPVDVWVEIYQWWYYSLSNSRPAGNNGSGWAPVSKTVPNSVAEWRAAGKEYWWYWCGGPDYGTDYPQYWLNSLVEWPAIASRLLLWLTALNSVSGLLFWVDDVWAGEGANGWVYSSWQGPYWANKTGQPGGARMGPGSWVHRLYTNGSCALAGQAPPRDNTSPRPMCNWREATMKTDGLCSSSGGGSSNGDGSWMFPGPDGAPLSSVRLENIRDGIEDYELFRQLSPSTLATLLAPVITNGPNCSAEAAWNEVGKRCVDWHDDPAALERVRREAARLVMMGSPQAARSKTAEPSMKLDDESYETRHGRRPQSLKHGAFDASTPFATAPIPLGLKMPGPAPRNLADRFTDVINVKDYFARGDGTGTTPLDEGVDISSAPWNNWTLCT
eukprot:COSAG06_NODE_644_length_13470_cov_22.234313_3_plen_813_part_00